MKKVLLILIILVFTKPVLAESMMNLGLKVFNGKGECATCHTLQAARSTGNIGPNLDKLKPQIDKIIYAVTNGIGVMPSWDGILTVEEIEAVAYYVFKSANK